MIQIGPIETRVGAGEDSKSETIPIRFIPDHPTRSESTNQKKRCLANSSETVNHPFVRRIFPFWKNAWALLPTPSLGIFMCQGGGRVLILPPPNIKFKIQNNIYCLYHGVIQCVIPGYPSMLRNKAFSESFFYLN